MIDDVERILSAMRASADNVSLAAMAVKMARKEDRAVAEVNLGLHIGALQHVVGMAERAKIISRIDINEGSLLQEDRLR